jgi:hypothetical protein
MEKLNFAGLIKMVDRNSGLLLWRLKRGERAAQEVQERNVQCYEVLC